MKHTVRFTAAVSILALLLTCLAGTALAAPDLHAIPYPADYPTNQDEDGADAYENSLDHPDSKYYVVNDFYSMQSEGSLHLLSQFETYQQTTEYTCGVASARMVLHWFGVDDYDEMQLAELAGTDTSKGTSVEGLVDFFAGLGWNVEFHADTTPAFEAIEGFEGWVIDHIDAGIPVMVDWIDWQGHWQVVIGVDTCGTEDPYDDVLILADPYDITDHYQDGYYTYPFGRFFDMWREGICAQKDVPYEQPFVCACPTSVGY